MYTVLRMLELSMSLSNPQKSLWFTIILVKFGGILYLYVAYKALHYGIGNKIPNRLFKSLTIKDALNISILVFK